MPLTGKRILVVDDHEIMRRMVSRLLQSSGGNIECATNGRKAVERLAVESFDLVLMDYNMPEMNGLEAAAHIMKLHRARIVLMSSDDIGMWARRLGCAFVLKGCDLMEAVVNALQACAAQSEDTQVQRVQEVDGEPSPR